MTTLKPCPFCGGHATIHDLREAGKTDLWLVGCDRCNGEPLGSVLRGGDTEAEAIAAWNSRSGMVCGENGELCPACSLPAQELTQVPGCGGPVTAPSESRIAQLEGALRRQAEFVDTYMQPWGAWKTAWWEGEVSDNAAISEDNALKHLANMARTALNAGGADA